MCWPWRGTPSFVLMIHNQKSVNGWPAGEFAGSPPRNIEEHGKRPWLFLNRMHPLSQWANLIETDYHHR
jgi:hypothetical protein